MRFRRGLFGVTTISDAAIPQASRTANKDSILTNQILFKKKVINQYCQNRLLLKKCVKVRAAINLKGRTVTLSIRSKFNNLKP